MAKVCNVPGCPTISDTPRCPEHTKAADKARPDRGVYSKTPHRRFRRRVLKRDPLCVLCGAIATVADHYPTSRRDLVAQGLDPNDPTRGRGLCAPCHNKHTANTQGGAANFH